MIVMGNNITTSSVHYIKVFEEGMLKDRMGKILIMGWTICHSDANAALYWLGRMLEAGEDPLYIARRMVRMASEDIGLADNAALPLVRSRLVLGWWMDVLMCFLKAMSAYHACEKIGMPECDTILAHVATYLAETKKSVRTYKAYNKVKSGQGVTRLIALNFCNRSRKSFDNNPIIQYQCISVMLQQS